MIVRPLGAALGLVLGLPLACSSDAKHSAPPEETGGASASGGGAGTGGSGSGGDAFDSGVGPGRDGGGASGGLGPGGATGAGGMTSSGGGGGAGGSTAGSGGVSGSDSGTPPVIQICGNGLVEGTEACDGLELGGVECTTLGFDQGTLGCRLDCHFDVTGCRGSERCADGVDNDGDGARDCADSECTAQCATACGAPAVADDPSFVTGETNGRSNELSPSCLPSSAQSSQEIVYQVTPVHTGVLVLELTSAAADLNLSVRTTCSDAATEIGCREAAAGAGAVEALSVPVTAGTPVFVVVDGTGAGSYGSFSLDIQSRTPACGDGLLDPPEECDDHNKVSGDGCSSTCKAELDEHESNDAITSANPITQVPFIGRISSVTDVDYFSIQLTVANSQLFVDTHDLGDGACAANLLDNRVEIIGPDKKTVLSTDDDGGVGFCAKTSLSGLAAGTYYVKVQASGVADAFSYAMDITKSP